MSDQRLQSLSRECIEDQRPPSVGYNQPVRPHDAQVLRNKRLRGIQSSGQSANILRTVAENCENSQSNRVSRCLEDFRNVFCPMLAILEPVHVRLPRLSGVSICKGCQIEVMAA